MKIQEHVEIKFPSDMIYVGPIRAFIVRLAQRLGFQPLRIEDIELAADEVCNNAIEHGSGDHRACISILVSFNRTRFEILVRDSGTNNQKHWLRSGRLRDVRCSMSPESERGHGIYLVETLADEVEFKLNELGGTDVRMAFYLDTLSCPSSGITDTIHA